MAQEGLPGSLTGGPDAEHLRRVPREPSISPSRTPDAGAPVAGEQDAPLWPDESVDPHSSDFWAQSNVTLKTREELTAHRRVADRPDRWGRLGRCVAVGRCPRPTSR
ncbi:hypothetical protein GCM10010274_09210 [Streptomyces lavendofoliae]|uniref:Uncharacterized protein n=1 Tax=Streptomyces lavendofoliae TaxID=67314 RepID=A0A918M2X9_9ACTN|nr:hypothetical protein GCM10010274_09210 [Streptomyces lavendofoliae]